MMRFFPTLTSGACTFGFDNFLLIEILNNP